jgi:ABC-type multidrug transport system fused ATPase/permease subunit
MEPPKERAKETLVITTIQAICTKLTVKEQRHLFLGAAGEVVLQLADTAFFAGLLLMVAIFTGGGTVIEQLPFATEVIQNNYVLVLVGFLLAYAGKNILAWWWTAKLWQGVYHVAWRLSAQNLEAYFQRDYHQYVHEDSAAQIRKVSQQPVEFALYLLRNTQLLLGQVALLLLIGASLLLYKPQLVALLMVFLLPPAGLLILVLQRQQYRVRDGVKTASSLALQYLKEALGSYVESRVFDRKDFFITRYARQQGALNSQLAAQQSVQGISSRMMELVAVLAIAVLLIGSSLFEGAVSIVTIGAFAAAAYKVLPGLVRIINSLGQIKAYAFVLDDLPKPISVSRKEERVEPPQIHSICFKNVSFSFGDKPILQHFTCTARSGDFVGIRGLSGKGKTTLVNLLLGFHAPGSGTVRINEEEVTKATASVWWKRISYTKQQPFLVHDTALTNVVLTEGAYNEERYRSVAELSGCSRFTSGPPGVDCLIRENGRNISGGQRQRLSLARALYKDFDLLILDEPFSEMDEGSERALLQHLSRLAAEGKIILLITHHTESLRYCTKIVSLD